MEYCCAGSPICYNRTGNRITKNEEEKIPEVIDIFNELQEKLSSYGVIFNFMFDAKHDRKNL